MDSEKAGSSSPGGAARFRVTGSVSSPDSAAVGGIEVRLVDKNVGADVLLVAGHTDPRGQFVLQAEITGASLQGRHKSAPDLQVQALDGDSVLASSVVRYNASTDETLDVALPAGATRLTEYETLRQSVGRFFPGSLANLREDDQQQDITYLANKSGWDARAVAMGSIAERLGRPPSRSASTAPKPAENEVAPSPAARTGTGIDPALYYALLRAGLPSDPVALHQTRLSTVQAVWQQAVDRRVIPAALEKSFPAALRQFQVTAAASALTAPPPVGVSTLGELLRTALGDDQQRQQQFAQLYVQYRQEPDKMWAAAEQAFGSDTTARLRLDGQLAYLTVNNAPLIAALHAGQREGPITSAVDLVTSGYGQASTWAPLLANLDPPAGIAGENAEEKRAAYAELLAAQLRVSFPTASIGYLVRHGAMPMADPATQADVAAFLNDNHAEFDIGAEPVASFVRRSGAAADQAVIGEITRLQRAYQITPSHEAMAGLLHAGIDSAYQAVNLGQAQFVEQLSEHLDETQALQVYSRATGVYASTLNVALGYLGAKRAPGVGGGIWQSIIDPLAEWSGHDDAPPAQATLDDLFKNLDYCTCDDCRSIISPAAYLVDLLHYLDGPAGPHGTPQDVLLARRPDIGALPLTCDNTNVALPYLDLVNETLEYYVGNHLSMTGYAGHTTDGSVVSSAELQAAPQNDDDATAQDAYATLKQSWFPAPLPFHRDLERLRRRMTALGSSLYEVLSVQRSGAGLEAPVPADPSSYGWRDILAERLGISRLEYQLLTDSADPDLAAAFGYPVGTDVVGLMSPLQEFSRRTGVGYDDIASIVQTRFVNSAASLIPLFQALTVNADQIKALHDNTMTAAQFGALLPTVGIDPGRYGAADVNGIANWVLANYDALMSLIVIDVDGSPCDTTSMVLRYYNTDNARNALHDVDMLRLLRFIRLWRRLGLSIAQTDDLLSATYEPSTAAGLTDLQRLDSGMMIALPRIGLIYQVIDLLGLDVEVDLGSVLALWNPISESAYAQMFLNPATVPPPPGQHNPFLPAIDGSFPHGGLLLQQRAALCSALNLTSAEFDLITGAGVGLGYDGTTALTLDTISAVYRRAWLARTLQLSVVETLYLSACTGVDPFARPVLIDGQDVSSPTLDFIRLAQGLADANLAPVQALYLLWNVDLSGVSVPDPELVTGLAAALRSTFTAVDAQFAVTPKTTMDSAQGLAALVLGPVAATAFVGMLDQTNVTTVSFAYTSPQLPAAVIAAGKSRVNYDDLGMLLSFTGYLDAVTVGAMKAAAPGDAELAAGLDALGTAATKAVDDFFARYDDNTLRLRGLFDDYVTSADPAVKGNLPLLLGKLLPVLADRRKQQQALTAVSSAAGIGAGFAPGLLDTGGVLVSVPTETSATPSPAVDDLTALGNGGLSVSFFFGDDPTAAADKIIDVTPSLTYGGGHPLRPVEDATANPFAATWSGYLIAAQDGDYNLRVALDAGATLELTIDAAVVPGAIDAQHVWSNTAAIPLSAGRPVAIAITAQHLGATFAASWKTVGTGWQPIPASALIASRLVGYLRTTYLRFLKATGIAQDLRLTAAELMHLATAESLTVGGKAWPASLVVEGPAPAASAAELTNVLRGLLSYAYLKTRFPSASGDRTVTLLTALEDLAQHRTAKLLSLTGWDPVSLPVLVARLFNGAADLAAVPGRLTAIRRLDEAYAVIATCRLSASTLIAAATNDPSPTVVRDFEAAMRSRYAESDWLAAIKPTNDELRRQQRDALVAYILLQRGVQMLGELGIAATANRVPTADDLFNWFLMDVEMQPCMETSRIRHALSSVQLFIERCLRHLEPNVDPTAIAGSEWSWRKRYRVWQANREVFLWPENWMDPSLRDDQSPIFKSVMSKLLQSDITDDAAASAYLSYLSNLELVAKLEPCAMYVQRIQTAAGPDERIHVVARSSGTHRKYYYRVFDVGSWTPWEEIKVEVEDVPLSICVWNNRVLLMWLQIHAQPGVDAASVSDNLPKSDSSPASMSLTDLTTAVGGTATKQTALKVTALLCFSEYYNGQWQPVRTSEIDDAVDITGLIGQPKQRPSLALRVWDNGNADDEALYVQVTTQSDSTWVFQVLAITLDGFSNGPGFVLHNTHSSPLRWSDVGWLDVTNSNNVRLLPPASKAGSTTLTIDYQQPSHNGWLLFPSYATVSEVDVLTGDVPQTLIPAQPLSDDQWNQPFFMRDIRNAFYVKTSAWIMPLIDFTGYGLSDVTPNGLPSQTIDIPPLYVKYRPPKPGDPIEYGQGLVDPVVAERSVASTNGMRAVIGLSGTVTFGDRQIGATGSYAGRQPGDIANQEAGQ